MAGERLVWLLLHGCGLIAVAIAIATSMALGPEMTMVSWVAVTWCTGTAAAFHLWFGFKWLTGAYERR